MSAKPIPYEKLIAYAAGELAPAEAAAITAALAKDPAAAKTVARFRRLRELGAADDSQDPPAATVQAALGLFRRSQPEPTPNWLTELRRVVAHLLYDSRPQLATAGLRGRGDTYQLSFESDLADVDLEIEATAAGAAQRRLRGQVSPHGEQRAAGIAVAAPGEFSPIATALPDEHGVFALAVPPGRFDLFVTVAEAVVVLPGVEVE